jgi:uncharacterized membrane protein
MGATLRRYFVAGLLVWIPLVITLWVLKLLVELMDQSLLLVPARYQSDAVFGFHVPGLGIILTAAIVLTTGALAANFFGRKLLAFGDKLLGRSPRGALDLRRREADQRHAFLPEGKAFRRAVLVRYPHPGAWTVALVTGTPEHEVADILGREQISVFVPTTPNITAGFFLIVPRSETVELDMSVDAAAQVHHLHGSGRTATPPPARENSAPGPTPIRCRRRERRRRQGDGPRSSNLPGLGSVPRSGIPILSASVADATRAMRTEYCGSTDTRFLGQTVTLFGWAHRRRDHGGVIFIDMRDREGLVQVVCDPTAPRPSPPPTGCATSSCCA